MNIRGFLMAAVGVLAFGAMSPDAARASEVLYDGSGFILGNQTFVDSFNLASPGTLTVTLTNVAWPEALASLNLALSSASGAMGPEMGPGTSTFDIKAGGNVFAQWFGTAQGPLGAGVFSMKIEFQPANTAVPLPTSIALLLSGLALLAWQRRTRQEPPEGLGHRAGPDFHEPQGV